MENLNTALLLMVVGMATVFAILLIVIYLGKGLIAPANVMASISAAGTLVTQGKGKVAKVEKI